MVLVLLIDRPGATGARLIDLVPASARLIGALYARHALLSLLYACASHWDEVGLSVLPSRSIVAVITHPPLLFLLVCRLRSPPCLLRRTG